MTKPARGLGRGLDSLLGGDDVSSLSGRAPVKYVNDVHSSTNVKGNEILMVPLDEIEPNPFQPRVNFDSDALNDLAASIRTLGLIQPITVRQTGERHFQIISGERRFRASKIAGLDKVPAYVRVSDDNGMLEMAIVENVQRENLDPIETAMSYQRLIRECNITQEQMAQRIGKSRVAVTNFLRLLSLPPKVQYELKAGTVSVGHAKVILGVEDPARQEELCDAVIRGGLSVRALEQLIREDAASGKKPSSPKNPGAENVPENCLKVGAVIEKYFGKNVAFKRSASGKGIMTVRFESDAQIDAFLKALEDANL